MVARRCEAFFRECADDRVIVGDARDAHQARCEVHRYVEDSIDREECVLHSLHTASGIGHSLD